MPDTTILDVLDSFFGNKLPDFSSLSEGTIEDFGKEVRRFSETYEPPAVKEDDVYPCFLGGWPSARWGDFSPLIMTSLLYSSSVLVKDLIIDWFSDEQYELPQFVEVNDNLILPREQRGYRTPNDNRDGNREARLVANRNFLRVTVPMFLEARKLIEKGILISVPSKRFEYLNQKHAEELATSLLPLAVSSVKDFTDQFRPRDLARTDNLRGLFMFMQSSNKSLIENQIRQEVREALYYFATEYLLAEHYGFTYTSTFPFEEHVCHNAITPLLRKQSGHYVYQGVLNSKLPLYQGLNPQVIADIRNDDNFVDFRRELYQIYADVPQGASGSDMRRHIREAEEVLLRPILQKLEVSEKKRPLSGLGFTRIGVLRMAATVLLGLAAPTGIGTATSVGVLGEVVQRFVQRDRTKGASVIWRKLFNHGRSIKEEFDSQVKGITPPRKPYWGIPFKDGMQAIVTEAIYVSATPKNTQESENEERNNLE
ncbi:MAG: hypothetical protein R3E39_21195 [Anaerolineae bacterium]